MIHVGGYNYSEFVISDELRVADVSKILSIDDSLHRKKESFPSRQHFRPALTVDYHIRDFL